MNKTELRAKYLELFKSDDVRDQKIVDSMASFLYKYKNISLVGIYMPIEKEIDISSIMVKFPDVRFAIPKITSPNMIFVSYILGDELKPNKIFNKYMEPVSNTEVYPKLIFVPGVAFSLDGHRLGRGKGHYDRYLAKHNPIKIGICTSDNMVLRLPSEAYDRKMDYIITEDIVLDLCS